MCKCGKVKVIECTPGYEVKCTACEVPPQEVHALKGWECPVCGAGVSPYLTNCPCHSVCDPHYMPIYTYPTDVFPQRYIITCGDQSDKVYGKSSCGL
jgi:hypothetical protein